MSNDLSDITIYDTNNVVPSVSNNAIFYKKSCKNSVVNIIGYSNNTESVTLGTITNRTYLPVISQGFIPATVFPATIDDFNKTNIYIDKSGQIVQQTSEKTLYGVYFSFTYTI